MGDPHQTPITVKQLLIPHHLLSKYYNKQANHCGKNCKVNAVINPEESPYLDQEWIPSFEIFPIFQEH